MPRNKHPDMLSLDKLIKRRVYKLECRNLRYGAFDGEIGFFGIRAKFDNRFIDHENHWDAPSYGTVANAIDTGVDLPDDVVMEVGSASLFAFLDETFYKPQEPT